MAKWIFVTFLAVCALQAATASPLDPKKIKTDPNPNMEAKEEMGLRDKRSPGVMPNLEDLMKIDSIKDAVTQAAEKFGPNAVIKIVNKRSADKPTLEEIMKIDGVQKMIQEAAEKLGPGAKIQIKV